MAFVKLPARDLNAHDVRFDPTDKRPIFVGINQNFAADSTTSNDWEVWSIAYDTASSNVVRYRRRQGTWTGRAALFT